MLPSSTKNVPATALRKVDFPEPLVPMMITHEPGSRVRLTPRSERTSLGLPELKVLAMERTSSMCAPEPRLAKELRHDECDEDETGGDELEIVGTEAPAEGDSDHQTKKDGSHHSANKSQSHLIGANQRFADDDACEPPNDHADAHTDVGESLILSEQRTGEGDKSVGDGETEDDHIGVIYSERANHLHVVAGSAHGHTKIGAKEEIKQGASERDGKSDGGEDRCVAYADFPADKAYRRDAVCESQADPFSLRGESGDGQQGNVAATHHVKIDGVEGGHHENTREQGVDLEAGVQGAGTGSGEHACGKGCKRCERGTYAVDQQSGGDGSAKSDRAVCGDIGKCEDAKADEHTEREQ